MKQSFPSSAALGLFLKDQRHDEFVSMLFSLFWGQLYFQ